MILDVRGTHGSGKSTVATHFTRMAGAQAVIGACLTESGRAKKPKEHVLGYRVPLPENKHLFVLGNYKNQCGGCDGIPTQEEITARVLHGMETHDHVLLEGILISHTFDRWNRFAQGKDWRFLFLNTSLNECIRRVELRRERAGNEKPLNPSNVIKDWHRVRKLHGEFQRAGRNVVWLDDYEPHIHAERILCT